MIQLNAAKIGNTCFVVLFVCIASNHAQDANSSLPKTLLAKAVEKQDFDAVDRILKQAVDVDQKQVDGMTPLLWAVYHDNLATAKKLLDRKANVNLANRYRVTPLSLACLNANTQMVQLLLDSGADANARLRGGETPLMTAARTGRVTAVQALIAHQASVHAQEHNGQTAIMWAAAEGHDAVVKELIRAGADFKTPLKSGFTPLLFAVRQGHAKTAQVLIDAGVDVHKTMQPSRPGGKAVRIGTSALMLAVENGHFELAMTLIQRGADPNDQRSGFTPLHAITWVRKPNRGDGADGDPAPRGSGELGSLAFVRQIVDAGADVNLQLEKGRTRRGRLTMQGATPFLLAAKTNDVPLMRLFLELGANPHLTNVNKTTPLMAAAGLGTYAPGEEAGTEWEAVAAVNLLLDLDADINAINKNGETAMHGAAYKSLPKVVQLLDQRGAAIDVWNRKNKFGWTPVLLAEGHRPGNFKPSVETLAALYQILKSKGLQPPPLTPRKDLRGYQDN